MFVFDIFTRKCGSVASPYELCALLWVEDCQLCFRWLKYSDFFVTSCTIWQDGYRQKKQFTVLWNVKLCCWCVSST